MSSKTSSSKNTWSEKEDELLTEAVESFGERGWANIASLLPGRIGKQCRDRWFNHLRPTLKRSDWSATEDRILFAAQKELGNSWSKIAKEYLPGRTDLSVKNRYYSFMRKVSRREKRKLDRLERSELSATDISCITDGDSSLSIQGGSTTSSRKKPKSTRSSESIASISSESVPRSVQLSETQNPIKNQPEIADSLINLNDYSQSNFNHQLGRMADAVVNEPMKPENRSDGGNANQAELYECYLTQMKLLNMFFHPTQLGVGNPAMFPRSEFDFSFYDTIGNFNQYLPSYSNFAQCLGVAKPCGETPFSNQVRNSYESAIACSNLGLKSYEPVGYLGSAVNIFPSSGNLGEIYSRICAQNDCNKLNLLSGLISAEIQKCQMAGK